MERAMIYVGEWADGECGLVLGCGEVWEGCDG
jgi:hypothetical protein